MAFTQITTSNLDNTITTKLAAAEAANAAVANIVSLAISSVQIANSTYAVLDDTAANTGGGYLVINGTGFTNQCVVIVGTTNATSTTFANTKQLRAQVPGLAAATYPLYVVDSVTGATAIKVNGLTYSSFPAWSTGSTLSNQAANTSFSVNLSANSDSAITYSNTTALPAGTTLAANGLFSGTVTIGAQTTYSFDVKATDAENQDVSRTFSLTVTVTPQTRLYAFGKDFGLGRLGLNSGIDRSSPVQVGTDTTWSAISASPVSGSFATKTDGTLWAWGANGSGQLGLNDRGVYRSSPTQVGTNTNWSDEIVSSRNFTAAIKTNGTLWLWGASNYATLGQNNLFYRSSPTQVGTGTDWSKIGLSMSAAAAIKTNGSLWTWGIAVGTNGQLGNNNTAVNVSSPVQIGSNTNWNLISGSGPLGSYRFSAIKTDGTLWAWGEWTDGALGLNNAVSQSSPTQVGTGTNWSKIYTGNHTMAIKTDGTLWAWGKNGNGQLGLNDRGVNRSSPVQVGTATNWSLCSVSNYNTMAVKTDGTLWAWGGSSPAGESGHLGLNSIIDRSSPVQVGTATNWSRVTSGNQFTLAITSN